MPDRMAGGAFALAADPSLLAAHAGHRGRLQYRGGAARRLCRIRAASVDPRLCRRQRHPFRTRSARWRCRRRMRGPARSAPPIRCGTTAAELRSTNTDVEGFINNLDACAPGWDKATEALVLGAGGASRAVVFGLIERGIKRVHLANRTIDARAGAGGSIRRRAFIRSAGMPSATCCRAPALLVNTTSLGMHGQPRARDRCRPAAAGCRRRRPRLCAAGDAAAVGGAGARIEDRRRARHAAAPGGARL